MVDARLWRGSSRISSMSAALTFCIWFRSTYAFPHSRASHRAKELRAQYGNLRSLANRLPWNCMRYLKYWCLLIVCSRGAHRSPIPSHRSLPRVTQLSRWTKSIATISRHRLPWTLWEIFIKRRIWRTYRPIIHVFKRWCTCQCTSTGSISCLKVLW